MRFFASVFLSLLAHLVFFQLGWLTPYQPPQIIANKEIKQNVGFKVKLARVLPEVKEQKKIVQESILEPQKQTPKPTIIKPKPQKKVIEPKAIPKKDLTKEKLKEQPSKLVPLRAATSIEYLNNPTPHYPEIARRRGQQGDVILKVLVSSDGSVISLDLNRTSSYSILDQEAMKAVKNWRFKPATNYLGQNIKAYVIVTISYKLQNGM